MNKLINIVLSGLLWRRYKFLIVTLILLIVSILIVGQIHQDYVEFVQTTDDDKNLGLSFALKWVVWLILFISFGLANHFFNKKKEKAEAVSSEGNTALSKVLKWHKNKKSSDSTLEKVATENFYRSPSEKDSPDPFAALREKDKLRSYADIIIKSKDKLDKK